VSTPKHFDLTGSSFDSFLEQENLLNEVGAVAMKRVIAWELKSAMKDRNVTKTQMAAQIGTSRSQVDRLLDPEYVGVSIETVARAANAVGKDFRFRMVNRKDSRPVRARKAAAGRSA
jgi:DNA-binding Xre family transcriptional regulator